MNEVLSRLHAMCNRNRLPHGLLFIGSHSDELFSASQSVTQHLLCESKTAPCTTCIACQKVMEKIHPDFMVVESEKQELSIDLIREFQIWLARGPHEASFKVGVIKNAETFNLASANALLKTLEEPPPYAKIILLTSSPDRFLPTILSRVQLVRFPSTGFETEAIATPTWLPELKELLSKNTASMISIFSLTEQIAKERQALPFFFDELETVIKTKLQEAQAIPGGKFDRIATVFEDSVKAEQDILRHYGNVQLTLDTLLARWFSVDSPI